MVIKVADYARHEIHIDSKIPRNAREEIAYDLHVGQSYKRAGDANPYEMPNTLILRPNDCVRIDTEEQLRTPLGVFGQICSRASLTAEGLVVANLKIDPNFHGRLNITAFNSSKRPIPITKGNAFCCVFFCTLESMLPSNAAVRVPPDARILTRGRHKEIFLRALPHVATFSASVGASLLAAYIYR